MTWGRALNKALRAAGVPSTFTKWRGIAAYRDQWRVLCGAKARGAVHSPSKHPRDIWAQAHPTTAPTRPRSQQPAGSRTPVEQQAHIHPRRPRLVLAMRYLLCEIWGVAT